jgi:hypothetical protein
VGFSRLAGHIQWYYFSVGQMKQGLVYTFNISNLCKRESLYSRGLRPLMFSNTLAKLQGTGWHRYPRALPVCLLERYFDQ